MEIARTSRVLSQMPSPMDIGALPQRGKGKTDKGKEKEVRVKMTKAKARPKAPPAIQLLAKRRRVSIAASLATSRPNAARNKQTTEPKVAKAPKVEKVRTQQRQSKNPRVNHCPQ